MNYIYAVLVCKLFVLLIMFQIKHFLADYPLQGSYMLGKFKPGWDFVKPLLAHVGVHMVFTYLILLLCCPWLVGWQLITLTLTDGVIHFVMDRIKAGPKYLGRFKTVNQFQLDVYKEMEDVIKYKYEGDPDKELMLEEVHKEKMDALKQTPYFWWSLGLDQMVHHLTHYLIVFIAIMLGLVG